MKVLLVKTYKVKSERKNCFSKNLDFRYVSYHNTFMGDEV